MTMIQERGLPEPWNRRLRTENTHEVPDETVGEMTYPLRNTGFQRLKTYEKVMARI